MKKIKIFISSVQKEFAKERKMLYDYFLAEPMYFAAYIERLGTGTTDILKFAKKANLPEPQFIQDDMFRTIIYRQKTPEVLKMLGVSRNELLTILAEKVGSKLVEKVGSKLAENQIKILILFAENSGVTKRELSEQIKISTTAIDKHIAKLKDIGILKRIGPDKGGYWEIIRNVN